MDDILQDKEYQASRPELTHAVNPLVAASYPLLKAAIELQKQNGAAFSSYQNVLLQAIKLFEAQLQKLGYRSQIILAARYLLCALIDAAAHWKTDGLINTFQKGSQGSERCFLILDHALADPERFIDILELGYLCINLGFLEKYTKTDVLYETIRKTRGDLSRDMPTLHSDTPKKKFLSWHVPSIRTTVIISLAILAVIFIHEDVMLNHQAKPILQSLHNINQSDK